MKAPEGRSPRRWPRRARLTQRVSYRTGSADSTRQPSQDLMADGCACPCDTKRENPNTAHWRESIAGSPDLSRLLARAGRALGLLLLGCPNRLARGGLLDRDRL